MVGTGSCNISRFLTMTIYVSDYPWLSSKLSYIYYPALSLIDASTFHTHTLTTHATHMADEVPKAFIVPNSQKPGQSGKDHMKFPV